MSAQVKKVMVATVGLSDAHRALIDAQCRMAGGAVELSHTRAWTFGLLQAQVLVIDMDSGVGKETLEMLESFRESAAGGRPEVLRFTASEFHAAEWSGRLDAISMARRDQESAFCKQLQQTLCNMGVTVASGV